MIGFMILLLLVIAFYVGGRRGGPLQVAYSIGYLISFLVAASQYQDLAKKIELFVPYLSVTPDSKMVFYTLAESLDLDKSYYAAVAFIFIFFIGWLVTRFIGIFLYNLRFKRMTKNFDWLISGVLNALTVYLVIFLVMSVLSMLPLATIQNVFRNSFAARTVVEHTPFFSWFFEGLWFTNLSK